VAGSFFVLTLPEVNNKLICRVYNSSHIDHNYSTSHLCHSCLHELHTISVKLNTRCKGDFWLMDFVANLALQGGSHFQSVYSISFCPWGLLAGTRISHCLVLAPFLCSYELCCKFSCTWRFSLSVWLEYFS
jgi:hypothetical protein